MNKDLLAEIKKQAATFFENSRGSHDWSHTERVYNLCMKIAANEGADSEIVGIAALLHDIGREEQDQSKGKTCHAQAGAVLSSELLRRLGLDEDKISHVVHCIETHRFRGTNKPQTKEAKVLFDADKLDSIGAVGIGRAFQFAGEVGARLHNGGIDIKQSQSYSKEDTAYREFTVKLRKIKDRMLTEEGKRMAEERHRFMIAFFDRLNDEVEGKV